MALLQLSHYEEAERKVEHAMDTFIRYGVLSEEKLKDKQAERMWDITCQTIRIICGWEPDDDTAEEHIANEMLNKRKQAE